MMKEKFWQQRMFKMNARTVHTLLLLTLAFALAAMLGQRVQAQTYTVLHAFTGGADGGEPYSGVILDGSGNLYGTTFVSGDLTACGAFRGCGTVYKLDPSGNLTVLHTFEGRTDGREPEWGNLFMDKAGNLFDTTSLGGIVADVNHDLGLGTIYELTPAGKEIILHRFAGGPNDGSQPSEGLIQEQRGTFYGTTATGGSSSFGECGTVYKMTPAGKVTILFNFAYGCQPTGGLITDAAGNMYGMTSTGGSRGYGTVFKITQTGVLTTLHTFLGQPDGAYPGGSLTIDKAGNLYGTTPNGGDPHCTTELQGCGIVFEIDTQGNEHILHSFLAPEGGEPFGGVTLDETTGILYGTTTGRAAYNYGSIFKLDLQGNFTKLYDFNGTNGGFPFATMTMDSSGALYGTASLGGGVPGGCDSGCGVVFKLTPQ